MELVIEFLGAFAMGDSFLPVCRLCFNSAICHPNSFRAPVQTWRVGACKQLDEQFRKMREPPSIANFEDHFEDLRVGLEHADEELKLTELSASFPSGVTVVLLRYARRLSTLLRWVNSEPPGDPRARSSPSAGGIEGALQRRRYLVREAEEFRQRVTLLAAATHDLRKRLPDPELPMRWAQWFQQAGEIQGFPEGHCMRYRSQREQVAAVWANNRRTFLSTDEHVDALLDSLNVLDDLVEGFENEDAGQAACKSQAAKGWWPAACGAGPLVGLLLFWGLAERRAKRHR